MKIDIISFLRRNRHKKLTIAVWFYTGWFRFCIRFIEMKRLRPYFGVCGEESPEEASEENYRYAKLVSAQVGRSARKTPWESKCLVRALTAQKLLKRKGIASTMYLGVKTEDNKMVAHAWLRVGKLYVTGGNGKDYAMVDKYRA